MNTEQARLNMIEQQIRPWEVLDSAVLSVLAAVKREDFVPRAYRSLAFADTEIALPAGQSMLEPKVEARFLQELRVQKHERVLEVGAGSGFMAALLAQQAHQVYTLEIEPELALLARHHLTQAAIGNVQVIEADASQSLDESIPSAPLDVIVLSGSVATPPVMLMARLAPGGRLAAVLGEYPVMQAVLFTRRAEQGFSKEILFETVAPRLRGFADLARFRF
jgi:protein-L-isoaspartate(D-aspartate) O-methyltransferase